MEANGHQNVVFHVFSGNGAALYALMLRALQEQQPEVQIGSLLRRSVCLLSTTFISQFLPKIKGLIADSPPFETSLDLSVEGFTLALAAGKRYEPLVRFGVRRMLLPVVFSRLARLFETVEPVLLRPVKRWRLLVSSAALYRRTNSALAASIHSSAGVVL